MYTKKSKNWKGVRNLGKTRSKSHKWPISQMFTVFPSFLGPLALFFLFLFFFYWVHVIFVVILNTKNLDSQNTRWTFEDFFFISFLFLCITFNSGWTFKMFNFLKMSTHPSKRFHMPDPEPTATWSYCQWRRLAKHSMSRSLPVRRGWQLWTLSTV